MFLPSLSKYIYLVQLVWLQNTVPASSRSWTTDETVGRRELTPSPPGQNGRYFTDNIFRGIFLNETFCILIKILLDDGLETNRWQATIWTNAAPIHWCIYAALGVSLNIHWIYMTTWCKFAAWLIIQYESTFEYPLYVRTKYASTVCSYHAWCFFYTCLFTWSKIMISIMAMR